MKNENVLGEILKQYRMDKRLSQGDLARILNMKQQQLARYENGAAVPREDTLRRMADCMNIPYLSLIDRMSTQDQIDTVIYGGSDQRTEFMIECITEKLRQLNYSGQVKAHDLVEMITKIPEYQIKG